MKLCLDVGNSHIYGGVYESDRIANAVGGIALYPGENLVIVGNYAVCSWWG